MTTLLFVLIGLVMGAVFGLALEKSRVFEPGMIVGQMQLRNFIMLKVFLAAVATGLVVLAVLTAIAIPAYRNYISTSRNTEGRNNLAAI